MAIACTAASFSTSAADVIGARVRRASALRIHPVDSSREGRRPEGRDAAAAGVIERLFVGDVKRNAWRNE